MILFVGYTLLLSKLSSLVVVPICMKIYYVLKDTEKNKWSTKHLKKYSLSEEYSNKTYVHVPETSNGSKLIPITWIAVLVLPSTHCHFG